LAGRNEGSIAKARALNKSPLTCEYMTRVTLFATPLDELELAMMRRNAGVGRK